MKPPEEIKIYVASPKSSIQVSARDIEIPIQTKLAEIPSYPVSKQASNSSSNRTSRRGSVGNTREETVLNTNYQTPFQSSCRTVLSTKQTEPLNLLAVNTVVQSSDGTL